MSVIRWNPLREFDELFAHAAHAQTSRQVGGQSARAANSPTFTPVADIAETDESYFIELELPGFAASDVDVAIHDGVLSVAGERKPAHVRDSALGSATEQEPVNDADSVTDPAGSEADSDKALETRRVHRTERAFGKFERRFRLPKDADVNAVSATAKNGVLTLEVGRLAQAVRRAIEIQVA